MSPFDMLVFFFFILVTIKAASGCIDYFKDYDEDLKALSAPARPAKAPVKASLSRTVRTGIPSSVRVTPIKRVNTPSVITAHTYRANEQLHIKDKGVA